MVEFWTDHFNQDYDKVGYLLVADQRDVIRANALGKFPDAAQGERAQRVDDAVSRSERRAATARRTRTTRARSWSCTRSASTAATRRTTSPSCRACSRDGRSRGRGTFTFNPAIHDWGAKTVLGVTIPAGSPSLGAAGINEGEQMLDVLANHPSTATFIATKMLRWLLDPESERRADHHRRVGVQGDRRRHQVDDPRDPQRLVAAGGADEAQAAVPFRRVVAALGESDGHHDGDDQQPARRRSAIRSTRGTRRTGFPTRSSTGRATSCRGGTTRTCSRT